MAAKPDAAASNGVAELGFAPGVRVWAPNNGGGWLPAVVARVEGSVLALTPQQQRGQPLPGAEPLCVEAALCHMQNVDVEEVDVSAGGGRGSRTWIAGRGVVATPLCGTRPWTHARGHASG